MANLAENILFHPLFFPHVLVILGLVYSFCLRASSKRREQLRV